MQKGAVWLSRQQAHRPIRKAAAKLKLGDTINFYYQPDLLQQLPLAASLLQDCGDFSVWYKPSGMQCQGSRWCDHLSLQRVVEVHFVPTRPAFIIHRLDKAASGLIVLAHSKSAAAKLSALFEQRQIKKVYRAWVSGQIDAARVAWKIDMPIDGKPALSKVSIIKTLSENNLALVEVDIATGRKHQIRKHLASMNLPIVGDRLHGKAKACDPDLQLRASQLCFQSPFSGEIVDIKLEAALALDKKPYSQS